MDIVSYALNKKIAEHAVSGVQSMSVEGQNLIINTKDSGVLTMTFPTPKDGVSVTDIDVNANNQIVFTMSDGTEFISGKIPTVKGDAGFSPTITENADNTDKIYKLDITTVDSTFTTPNLKGGAGGSGEENKIDSISVNGVNIAPDENKNVDITVPTVTNDLTDELKSLYDDAVTEKHTHDNKTILDDITVEKVESWNKAEENVQSDWNETDNTADGFIKNKPTIPDAYDDTALSGRVDDVETSIGDMSTIEVKSVSDLVSAINVLYNAFMSSITYANKKLTITYRNGGTVDIDMSAIITDTNIGELSNIDDTGVADKQVLSYDTATNKYIPTTIDTAGVLADAKKYTDDEIAKINNADAISVDEKPTYSNGTITYKKDGVEKTITDGDFWFFYTVDNMAYQTIWIDGVEFTTSVDGSVDFKDFVSKTNDLTSTYTGEETDKTKVTTIASLDALYAIISTALSKKVNTTDIVDNLSSDAIDKPLSAAQGKALDTKISNFVTTVEEDYAKTAEIPTSLPANGGNSDTVNNHTVETDVPADAVFTDTVYDDTEVKESIDELNSNLDELAYGEFSGNDNICDIETNYIFPINIMTVTQVRQVYTKNIPQTSDGYFYAYISANLTEHKSGTIAYYIDENDAQKYLGQDYIVNKSYRLPTSIKEFGLLNWGSHIGTISGIMFSATPITSYEPYIPSVKMLAEEVNQQNESLDTLAYDEIAGGKQLHDGKIYHFYQNVASPSVCAAYDNADSIIFETANLPDIITVNADNSNRNIVCYYDTFPSPGISSVTNITEATSGVPKNITVDKTHKYILIELSYGQHVSNIMVNEGSTSVPYEPYIPSVKMLAEEVDNVNESLVLQGLSNMNDGTWIQGITNSEGEIQPSTTAVTTNKKNCSSGDLITVKTEKTFEWFVVTCVDSSGIVTLRKNNSDNLNINEFSVTAPANTVGFYISLQTTNTSVTPQNVGNVFICVNNAIDEIKNDLNEQGLFKKSTIKNNSGISVENGGVYTTEKTFSTDYIDVRGYTKITCNKYSFTNNLLWGAFYDSSKNYISGFNQNSKTITVPNNANYIRLTFMNEDIDDVYICAGVIGDVAEEVNQQNESLGDYGLDNKFDGNIDYNKWYNKSNGEYQSSSTSATLTNKINCVASNNVRVMCPSATNVSIVFYNSSDEFISGTDKDGTDVQFIAPTNASYCRINFYKSGGFGGNIGKIGVYINNAIDELKNDLSVIGKCKNLLNPTLQTTTQNGVTCTANGDGTYTLNGTATSNIWFTLGKAKLYSGKTYRLCGLNKVDNSTLYIQLRDGNIITQTTNNGIDVSITETSENYLVVAFIPERATYNNIIYKPMITEDLTVTYDDFVPYTGDGETLTHDVAQLKNDFVALPTFIKIPYADTSNEITITVPNGGSTRKIVYLFTTQGMYSMFYVSSRDEVQLITSDENTTVSIKSGKLTITRNNILYYSRALAIVV